VLLDAEAWEALSKLGLAGWTGVRAVKGIDVDMTERLTGHGLNGRYAGWSRDCRQSFWKERAYALEAGSERAAGLSQVVDYGGQVKGTSMTAFENELGGRVVVLGYYPWSQVHSLAKSSQMKAVVSWVSGGKLPALVESYSKVVVWCRGKAMVLLNASLDPAEEVVVRWKAEGTGLRLHGMDGAARAVTADGAGRIRLPRLEAWSIYLLAGG
jgi:hypothetical protein